MFAAATERFDDGRVDFGGGEGIAGRNLCEAHERTHEAELPQVIELEAGNAFARRGDRRFGKFSQLAAIDKGFKDILLHIPCGAGDHLVEVSRLFADGLLIEIEGIAAA
jgi:hypothetical protein